ncbi:MAG TPA: UTP--glucose-1-phosphate uridylyltransferase [Chlamydiales bacterium]|nr:UTP--glucose-1-phosphate uridylyltransferase [Chlamydiales bacterium]
MFRSIRRLLLPNSFDANLKKCAKKGGKKVCLGWNRGLGDIALGLYAMIQRIREFIPDAEITFVTRANLKDGFSLLKGINVLIDPDLQRGMCWDLSSSLKKMGKDPKSYDLLIPRPNPTEWVRWQRGKVVPKLQWKEEELWRKFDLPDGYIYIGVQCVVETSYGLWRNWPLSHWEQLFSRLVAFPHVKILLLGGVEKTTFNHQNLIDLRGKTSLFELLSIVRHKCSQMILPDSGILSMVYYLDISFPIHVISLWGDPDHGILKQAVASPNPQCKHTPLIGALRDLSTVTVDQMMNALFPPKPLRECPEARITGSLKGVGTIILAGGQGSRLGHFGPKGTFQILGKSLFEWICEKAPKEHFPIAVMTSPINHEATVEFFAKNHNFEREIYFFQQEMASFLDERKKETSVQVPSGNGSVFASFANSGLLELFQQKGIDLITIVPVENPLANVADPLLIGHARGSDVTLKCVKRESPLESMGAIVEREGKIEIVEYMDLDPKEEYVYSNTGMMAISLSFFEKMKDIVLPIHWVRKKLPGTKKWGWKGEKFIFDVLPFARTSAVCFSRKSCYAPLKNIDAQKRIEETLLQMNHLAGMSKIG